MFNNFKSKEINISKIYFCQSNDSEGSTSHSENLTPSEFFIYLKELTDKQGQIVVDNITKDNQVYLTTLSTKLHLKTNDKIEEISDLVKDYIKGNAVKMKAYSVVLEGQTVGIYTEHLKAKANKTRLIREGNQSSQIEIKEVCIE